MPRSASADSGVLLFAYNDLNGTSADSLYESLVGNNIWLTSRLSKLCVVGMQILFYQARVGFRGVAVLSEIGTTTASDWRFPGVGFRKFPIRLLLSDINTFASPIPLKRLAGDLDFVTNKTFWGQAVQSTPRIISKKDLQVILSRTC
jgi:hypothetical protein